MKKILISILAAAALLAVSGIRADAQGRFGVMGGFSFTHASDLKNRGTATRYHAGLTYQYKLPMGFAIQPSLLYHSKGAKVSGVEGTSMDVTAGFIELPVSFQWGPDLLLFRPFLDVTPYVAYGVNNKISGNYQGLETESLSSTNSWGNEGLNRWDYGLGIGLGVEIWRFQVIGRYNWSFAPLYNGDGHPTTGAGILSNVTLSESNFRGLTLSVAFLF